jgi:alpha-tubulin suppressor-like RCC1 family protein
MRHPWTLIGAVALFGCPNQETDSETDSETETETDTDSGPVNTPPTVTAGEGTHALVGDAVWLTATGEDADGDALTFWVAQTAGPSTPLLERSAGRFLFRPRAVGRYTFEVTAADEETASEPATIDVVVHDLAAGAFHTVYLDPDGGLWSWGSGVGVGAGALDAPRTSPGPVCDVGATDCAADPLTGVVAVSAGAEHVLALTSDGRVLAWGINWNGQLGDGGTELSSTPTPVCDVGATDCAADPLDGVVAVAAGYFFSLALMSDGTVRSWGRADNGELGNASLTDASTPVQVCASNETAPCTDFLGDITHLRAGGAGHALALTLEGQLWGWGHNKRGQTGNGDATQREVTTPQRVCAPGATYPCATFLDGIVEMDPWSGNSFAITEDGTLYGWGGGDDGELGPLPETICNGELCAPFPTEICTTTNEPCDAWLPTVRDVVAGRRFSLALLSDGSVVGWGENGDGQLGLGHNLSNVALPSTTCAPAPPDRGVPPECADHLDDVLWIAGGDYHAFAYTADGTLYGWGNDVYGQVGYGSGGGMSLLPVAVSF